MVTCQSSELGWEVTVELPTYFLSLRRGSVSYAKTSKGYGFYYPSHSTRIVESSNTEFLENDMISRRDRFRDLIPVHDHIETQPSTSYDRLVIVHNTPQVPISVEQPIIEVLQVVENLPKDQLVQELPHNLEQTVEL